MSGPIAIEYVLVSALLDAAWGAYQEAQQQRAEAAQREQSIALRREQDRRAAVARREEERRSREAAKRRAERAAELGLEARAQERRLEHARMLAEEAHARYPRIGLDIPAAPPAPADRADPDAVERYIEQLRGAVRTVEARVRELTAQQAGEEGLQALMGALEQTVQGEPRTAAGLLDLYAQQVRALARPEATRVMDRRATAQRILGRLAGLDEGAVPPALDAVMRKLIEAPTSEQAEMFALELRAQVQRLNDARSQVDAATAENRRREIAGVLVAEVLTDLGYDVEPIAETLFVSGGVAHFQRAEWGDYYIRMRVDPITSNINFNMVRTADATAPPDAAQRKRDEETEAAWCAGIPKLLAELAARGIDTRKLRELDAGAVPVQVVKPETVDSVLRVKEEQPRTQAAPQTLARPLK